MASKRFVPLVLCVALLVSGCGGGDEGDELSLTEWVEGLNALIDRASQQYEELVASPQGAVLVAEGAQLADFTPQDLQVALERLGEIEMEILEAGAAIEPPAQVADLANLLSDDRFTLARVALAARAGSATSWEELSETPEMAAYRTALAGDKQACIDLQAKLDATAERGVFEDVPWIAGEFKEVVEAFLGCDGPHMRNPEDVYRPPPTSTP
jgi:hypothetical protein